MYSFFPSQWKIFVIGKLLNCASSWAIVYSADFLFCMTTSCQWARRSMSCGSAVHLSWISHASHKIPQPPILLVTARSPHVIVYPVYPVWRAWRACSGPGVTLVNFSTSLVIKYFCKFCSRCSEALLMTAIMCAVSTMEGYAGARSVQREPGTEPGQRMPSSGLVCSYWCKRLAATRSRQLVDVIFRARRSLALSDDLDIAMWEVC